MKLKLRSITVREHSIGFINNQLKIITADVYKLIFTNKKFNRTVIFAVSLPFLNLWTMDYHTGGTHQTLDRDH